jgi:multiple sugar transport system permease protein
MARPASASFLRGLALAGFLVGTLFPLYWVLKIAVTPTSLLYSEGLRWWPSVASFDHFVQVWRWAQFPTYFKNSVIVALSSSLLATMLAALAGYALSRWRFRGRESVTLFLLLTQMFSAMLIIVPLTRLFAAGGLIDSLAGLILAYAAFTLPFAVFLMRAFFDGLPVDVEEAASIDGFGRIEMLTGVLLPMVLPGLGATLGFVFVEAWSELFLALTLINGEAEKTLPTGLMSFITKLGINWGEMSAAGMIALLPACLFFAVVQRFLVAGLTAGAVKG